MNFRLVALTLLSGITCNVAAQDTDSVSLKPSFHADYTGEAQTNFKRVKLASALELGAEVPLNRHLTVELLSVSYVTTDEDPLINDLQGFSNIDSDNLAFALAVAGISWHINGSNSLFAGIRRIDEDYFCSDVLSLFTNSSCGGFPTIFANYDIATYPKASLGVHYLYDTDAFSFQTSIYNGLGHNKLRGGSNAFRFCPKSDGVCSCAGNVASTRQLLFPWRQHPLQRPLRRRAAPCAPSVVDVCGAEGERPAVARRRLLARLQLRRGMLRLCRNRRQIRLQPRLSRNILRLHAR